MLDNHVSGQVLGLFKRGSRRGGGGGVSRWCVVGRGRGVAADEVHLWFREVVKRVWLGRTRP